jgi:Major Facilitator Superfamily
LEKSEGTPPTRSSHSSDETIEDDHDSLAQSQHTLPQVQRRDTELIAVPEITNTVSGPELTCTITKASVLTSASRPSSFEVDFAVDDPEDPHNWPVWYRAMILGFVSFATWSTVLYSTSYTSAMPGMMKEFNQPSETVATLGITTYMIGLSVGSLVLAPVSEVYGREPVYIAALLFFCITTVPCALAKTLQEIQGMRFLG